MDKTLFVLLCANGYFVRHFVMSTYMPYCNISKERYLYNLQHRLTFCYRKTSFRVKICAKTTRKHVNDAILAAILLFVNLFVSVIHQMKGLYVLYNNGDTFNYAKTSSWGPIFDSHIFVGHLVRHLE